MGGEGSVLSLGHATLVVSSLAIDDGLTLAVDGGLRGQIVVLSVEIIPVEGTGELLHALGHSNALRGLGSRSHIVEVSSATLLLPVSEQTLLDDLEVSKSLWERGPNIVAPVGSSISNHGTTKVDLWELIVELSLEIVLVDLPCKIWNIDSTVRLTRDVELIWQELRIFFEPALECSDCVMRLDHVVGVKVSISASP